MRPGACARAPKYRGRSGALVQGVLMRPRPCARDPKQKGRSHAEVQGAFMRLSTGGACAAKYRGRVRA